MTKTIATIFLLFACLIGQAGELLTIPVNEVAATQTEVGATNVAEMMSFWAAKAKGDPAAFRKLVESTIAKPFPAEIGPSIWGETAPRVYLENGHHRAYAIHRLLNDDYDKLPAPVRALLSREQQLQWRSDPALMFRVDVQARRDDLKSLLLDFVSSGTGQLPPEVRNDANFRKAAAALQEGRSADLETLRKAYSTMAPRLSELHDSPLRSAVGNAFFHSGLDSDQLVDYIEFYVGERIKEKLIRQGLRIDATNATSSEVRDQVTDAIFGDPEIVSMLKSRPRAGHEEAARKTVDDAKEKYDSEEALRKPEPSVADCETSFDALGTAAP